MIERTTPMKSANIQSIFAAALVAMIVTVDSIDTDYFSSRVTPED